MTDTPAMPVPGSGQPIPPPPKKGVPIWVWLLALVPIGLCCLGVGAAVAIPGFIRYVKSSRAQEAVALVRAMQEGTIRYCTENRQLPPASGPVPSEVPGDHKLMGDTSQYPGFVAIGFTLPEPVHYQYSIVPDGADVLLRAEGDLDADGIRSRYEARCNASCECTMEPPVEPLE